jgi:HK97 family phage prohead protease
MAETFRAPKGVIAEARGIDTFEALAIRNLQPLSLMQVKEIRTSWGKPEGAKWASDICLSVAQRASVVSSEELSMTTEIRDIFDVLQAASLVDLLTQALSIATANVINETIEEAVDQMNQSSDEMTGMNSGSTTKDGEMLEERKSAIASAERITTNAEIRAVTTDDGSLKIAGYAAKFGVEADGLNFREMIAPGAFKRSLQSRDATYLLVNHDTNGIPLASTESGTMRLSEDNIGLRMEADLDPTNPKAQELYSALRRGDITEMSFSFTVDTSGETRENGLRTLIDVNRLFEVSPVTWGAYSVTEIGTRSAEDVDADLALRTRKAAAHFAFINRNK